MKYLKLFESYSDIKSICEKYRITNYTINSDGSIDVDGDVYLYNLNSTKLPLKFRNVSGYFDCSNNQLTTLEGCPQTVGGNFDCNDNQLTTLEGSPQNVGGYFSCRNNRIINFNGFPEDFEGNFFYEKNPVQEIYNLFKDIRCIKWINEFDVIQGNKVIMDRLEEVFHELRMVIPKNIKFRNYKII